MKKKGIYIVLSIVLTALLCVSLAACGSADDDGAAPALFADSIDYICIVSDCADATHAHINCGHEDCAIIADHLHDGGENCTHSGCAVEGEHTHCEIDDCAQTGIHAHNNCGIDACAQTGTHSHNCGVNGCDETGAHSHNTCGTNGCAQSGKHSHKGHSGSHH